MTYPNPALHGASAQNLATESTFPVLGSGGFLRRRHCPTERESLVSNSRSRAMTLHELICITSWQHEAYLMAA